MKVSAISDTQGKGFLNPMDELPKNPGVTQRNGPCAVPGLRQHKQGRTSTRNERAGRVFG